MNESNQLSADENDLVKRGLERGGFSAEVARTVQRLGRMSEKQRAVLSNVKRTRVVWQNWDDWESDDIYFDRDMEFGDRS